jgi:hypothetical protein
LETFDRYINPFDVKEGIDTLPNFVPEPHYLQVKSLCNEAYLKICTKVPLAYSLNEIKSIIKEYEYLFEETEIWIRLYSAFDNFSYLYLEICELKVLIEEYGVLCIRAIDKYQSQDRNIWLESNFYLFKYIKERIETKSLDLIRNKELLRINNCSMMVYVKELEQHMEFYEIYKRTEISF